MRQFAELNFFVWMSLTLFSLGGYLIAPVALILMLYFEGLVYFQNLPWNQTILVWVGIFNWTFHWIWFGVENLYTKTSQ